MLFAYYRKGCGLGKALGLSLGRHEATAAAVAYPGILFGGVSTNSVEGRGQRERGSGDGSP